MVLQGVDDLIHGTPVLQVEDSPPIGERFARAARTPWFPRRMQILAWALVAAALLAVAVLVRSRRALAARAEEAAREATAAHGRVVRALEEEHEARATALADAHARDRAEADGRLAEAVSDAAEARRRFASTWRTEVVSHGMIVEACRAAGLGGVLATNVVLPGVDPHRGARFLVQVDHVLLTPTGALIIEGKHWRGLVLDGIRPGDVHPAVAAMLPDGDLQAPFAVQVVGDGTSTSLTVRTHRGGDSPVSQVRTQARRLAAHIAERGGPAPWFTTVVLYSHPDALVLGPEEQRPGSSDIPTVVVAGPERLEALLAGVARGRTVKLSGERIERLVELLASDGAHIERIEHARRP